MTFRADAPGTRTPTADAQTVPRFLRGALYVLLVTAGALSLPQIGHYGPLPTTELLDAWMIAFMFGCIIRGRTFTTPVLLLLALYLMTRLVPALATSSPLGEFFRAYRWVLYLMIFAVAIGRKWGPVRGLMRLMWVLLAMAFTKAALTYLLAGPGQRPGLLQENNFELALFSGLAAVLYRHMKPRARFWVVVLLGGLTVLSGSRSGAVAFLIFAVYAISQARVSMFSQYVLAWVIPVLAIIPLWIFIERSQGVSVIDRLNFLSVFLRETTQWTPLTWIFGTVPITPLGSGSCLRLTYYQSLFSSAEDGSCYSVILHAFLLRVIFDAGLVGLLIAFGVTWWALRRAQVGVALALCLTFVALTNSMSVSGLNNPYMVLPILLALLTSTAQPPGEEADQASGPTQTVKLPATSRRRT